jgi:hypothetical protein
MKTSTTFLTVLGKLKKKRKNVLANPILTGQRKRSLTTTEMQKINHVGKNIVQGKYYQFD